jgi:hypothetical protein
VLRLALLEHLAAIHLTLLLHNLLGHVLRRYRQRIRGRDLHRQVARELLELIGARHEVRLAVQLQHHAHLA